MEDPRSTSPPGTRHLGPSEKYSLCRSHLGIYLNVCVTASYLIKADEALKPAIFRALAAVVRKHPILSAVPVDSQTHPRFVRLDSIDLERAVTFAAYDNDVPGPGDDALDRILEDQHNLPFGHEEPLVPFWRIIVLHSPAKPGNMTLCLCFHHSLADTKSALVFHEDLEYALSFPSTSEFSAITETSTEQLLPCLEDVFDLKTSDAFISRMQNIGQPPNSTWSGAAQTLPVHTRFSSLCLSSIMLDGLKAQSKAHGTSVTAVLMAVAARASFDVLPDEYTSLWGDCAVSLRPFLPLPITERSMGCYVGSFSEAYDRGNTSLWEDARRTTLAIDEVRHKKGADMPVGFLSHVSDMSHWLSDKIGQKRWAAWELSNVGSVTRKNDAGLGRCQIQSLLFSQSASACSGAVKISAVTGRDNQMGLGFSWQQGVVDEDIVMGLSRKMEEILINITD